MRSTMLLLLLSSLLVLSACGEDAAEAGKGGEDNGLEQTLEELGKADSFFRPTEHGELMFDAANEGSLTENAQFHAWSFALTEEAEFTLRTDVSANLDTVMYLYYREDDSQRWGRYIKKNDDHQKNIWSQISQTGKKGEYRVIVKGFKSALRGSFSVAGECSGAGCPEVGGIVTNDKCDPSDFASWPESQPAMCAGSIHQIFTTPLTAVGSGGARVTERCDLDVGINVAVELYVAYWEDFYGSFEEFTGEEDGEVYVNTQQFGSKGYMVSVDIGADEDTVHFLFDGESNLLMYFHDEQSPTLELFCDDSNANNIDEDCAARALYDLPHRIESEKSNSGETSKDSAANDLHVNVAPAVALFLEETGVDEGATITFEEVTWDTGFGDISGRVRLSAEGNDITYHIGDGGGDPVAVFREQGGETTFLCRSLL